MGTRGPKGLPTVVHLAKGNPSKKRFSTLQDGTRVPIEIPEPPEHLMPAALVEWKRIAPELAKLGLIALVDRAALAVYCQSFARWAECEAKLQLLNDPMRPDLNPLVERTSSGYKQMSVLLQISNRAVEQMHKFLAEFGMTPSARSRVQMSPQADLFGNEETPEQSAKSYFTGETGKRS